MADEKLLEPVFSPDTSIEPVAGTAGDKKHSSPILMTVSSFLLLLSLSTAGYLYFQNGRLDTRLTGAVSTEPASTPEAHSEVQDGWEKYSHNHISFDYPSAWIVGPVTGGDTYLQTFFDPEDRFSMNLEIKPNRDEATGKPYDSIDSYRGLPSTAKTLMIDGRPARQPFPQADSEDTYETVFFSKDETEIFSIKVESVSTDPADSAQQVSELFDRIVSSVKITK